MFLSNNPSSGDINSSNLSCFPHIFVHIWKSLPVFMGVYLGKDLIVHSLYVYLEGRRQGGSNLMSMSFEIVSIFVRLWYLFRIMSYCSLFTFI